MRAATISLIIAMGLFAGIAIGAETRAPAPPAPTPGEAEFCTRRDISPEDFAKNCVEQNGPARRPVVRGGRNQPKSGASTGTR